MAPKHSIPYRCRTGAQVAQLGGHDHLELLDLALGLLPQDLSEESALGALTILLRNQQAVQETNQETTQPTNRQNNQQANQQTNQETKPTSEVLREALGRQTKRGGGAAPVWQARTR